MNRIVLKIKQRKGKKVDAFGLIDGTKISKFILALRRGEESTFMSWN